MNKGPTPQADWPFDESNFHKRQSESPPGIRRFGERNGCPVAFNRVQ